MAAVVAHRLARSRATKSCWYLRGDEEVRALQGVLCDVGIEDFADDTLVVVVVRGVDAHPAGSQPRRKTHLRVGATACPLR